MRILGLYNNDCALELFNWLMELGHSVTLCSEIITPEWCRKQQFELTVSYTYRYILSSDVIIALKNNVVNIHNSVLPYNRGADPNIWSIIDQTPRGVTLHYMDAGLDKGFIIAQSIIDKDDRDTLSSSYYKLDNAAKELFKKAFDYYDYWPELKKRATGQGTYHSLNDGVPIKELIDNYEINVKDFRTLVSSKLWKKNRS